MAGKALKKVEDQLNCTICLDTYTDPKLLQCFHVYCHQCLVKLLRRLRSSEFVCPLCRQVTLIPAGGVAGLPSAFHINQLLEILDTHKKTASSAEGAGGASASNVPQRKVAQFCSDHGKELELYCETCEELVCLKCAIKGGKHHSHDCEDLNDAFEKCKREVAASLKPLQKQMSLVDTALAKLDSHGGEISYKRAFIKADIRNSIGRLREDLLMALNRRETELISQLDHITQGKLKGLAVQRDQIETTQAQLGSCMDFMKHSLRTGSQRDVLKLKTTIAKQVTELSKPLQPDLLTPRTSANMAFSDSLEIDLTELYQSYGKLTAVSFLDPSKCQALGKALEKTAVGVHSDLTLQVLSTEGTPFTEHIESLECKLVTERTGAVASCHVRRKTLSKYCITYQPTTKGRHQLRIKVEGHHIRGSPFSVVVRAIDSQQTTPLSAITEISRPLRVAVSKRGEVVVSESAGHRVSVFGQNGEKLLSFGGRGSNQGQFECPQGVTVDGQGNILVADGGNNRIQKFTAKGQFLASADTEGSPCTVACHPSNHRIYLTDGTDRVLILNPDLTFSGAFGQAGTAEHQLMSPQGIAFDSTGNVYIADSANFRIQVFSAKGGFLRTLNGQKLNWPTGVALDSDDTVFVSLYREDRVLKFSSAGKRIGDGRKWGQVRLSGPVGLAVDASGVLYMCDSGNDRVLIL